MAGWRCVVWEHLPAIGGSPQTWQAQKYDPNDVLGTWDLRYGFRSYEDALAWVTAPEKG